MAVNTQGTTVPVSFFSCNPDQTNLFSVCPGVPLVDALAMASSFLDVARDAAFQAGDGGNDNSASAAAYLITMAKAVIDSIINGVEFKGGDDQLINNRRGSDLLERLHQLFEEGVIIVNPEAANPAALDANNFLDWVSEQVKGGAQ